jgi:DNA mismatch repair protein MutL
MAAPEITIRLLPEALANQIAAGEVVQRPSSVVKELLENSQDAGADNIQLVIEDAGKALVQVVDNGHGMGPADARLAVERHATSKIQTLDDLFRIRTFGFRGEALASIAAVSTLTLHTRRPADELGTRLEISGGKFVAAEPCQCAAGTSIAVRNLFWNVPARRNFLKSNPQETRHILTEFTHMAVAWPGIRWGLRHNGTEVHDLPTEPLASRLLRLHSFLKPNWLLPLREETQYVTMHGYVGVPEAARKTRGHQYLYVNNRFIRSAFLHHAIRTAYADTLPDADHPTYALFLEIDPRHVDINIHPTKTEVKFDDEHTVYALLHAAVRAAIGRLHRAPVIPAEGSFEQQMFQQALSGSNLEATVAEPARWEARQIASRTPPRENAWRELYALGQELQASGPVSAAASLLPVPEPAAPTLFADIELDALPDPLPVPDRFWVFAVPQGLLLLDQPAAHAAIRHHELSQRLALGRVHSQALLFPTTIALSPTAYLALHEHLPRLASLGFDLAELPQQQLLVQGLPPGLRPTLVEALLEDAAAHLAEGAPHLPARLEQRLLARIAQEQAAGPGQWLPKPEVRRLLAQLLRLPQPLRSPTGDRTIRMLSPEDVAALFV